MGVSRKTRIGQRRAGSHGYFHFTELAADRTAQDPHHFGDVDGVSRRTLGTNRFFSDGLGGGQVKKRLARGRAEIDLQVIRLEPFQLYLGQRCGGAVYDLKSGGAGDRLDRPSVGDIKGEVLVDPGNFNGNTVNIFTMLENKNVFIFGEVRVQEIQLALFDRSLGAQTEDQKDSTGSFDHSLKTILVGLFTDIFIIGPDRSHANGGEHLLQERYKTLIRQAVDDKYLLNGGAIPSSL